MKFLKQILRILLSVPICIFGYRFFKFETFGNIIMFMGVYIVISFLLEFIFKKIEKKQPQKKA